LAGSRTAGERDAAEVDNSVLPAQTDLGFAHYPPWIGGVSTRRVDELVQAMGLSGISKSQVSKLCKDLDERVNAFLDRPLDGEWPYMWLDATYLSCRRRATASSRRSDGNRVSLTKR
jgi:hypothetical protein